MERTIKVRTFLGQAIDTFKEYIKTKGNLQIDYSLEEYMQEILDYIDYLEKENKELKKELKPNYYVKGLEGTLKEYQQEMNKVTTQQKEFIKYLEDKIYSIEPKGTGIIYNCKYDSEDDYVTAMREQSRLNTLKEILQKCKSIIGVLDENPKN